MPYDEKLADRIRTRLGKRKGVAEKKMFGGLAVLVNGNMCVGVHGEEMIARIDPAETDEALKEPHTRVFDLTGRPMAGWILVGPKGLATDTSLGKWVDRSWSFASAIEPKAAKR